MMLVPLRAPERSAGMTHCYATGGVEMEALLLRIGGDNPVDESNDFDVGLREVHPGRPMFDPIMNA